MNTPSIDQIVDHAKICLLRESPSFDISKEEEGELQRVAAEVLQDIQAQGETALLCLMMSIISGESDKRTMQNVKTKMEDTLTDPFASEEWNEHQTERVADTFDQTLLSEYRCTEITLAVHRSCYELLFATQTLRQKIWQKFLEWAGNLAPPSTRRS